MFKKIVLAVLTSAFLLVSAVASADPVTIVFSCELNDGKTKDDAMAVNAKWLKWARATGGSDEITSTFVATLVGDFDGFMWVDTYPDLATWAKVWDADLEADEPEVSAGFDDVETCSGNRMVRGEQTVPAK